MVQYPLYADPLFRINLQDLHQQVFHFFRDPTAELYPFVDDVVIDLFDLLCSVGGISMHQLVEEDAEAPDIDGVVVGLFLE